MNSTTNCTGGDMEGCVTTQDFVDGQEDFELYPISLVVPFTAIYAMIFVTGVVGNVGTCTVIARNKHMQTATNCYLFSLACSDLLLLLSALPPEMYRLWSSDNYIFGEAFCIMQGFFAETSANASVFTITAFTVERYLAICHPFLSHTMSKLSRAIRYIAGIWITAMLLAIPQAIQFGVLEEFRNGKERSECTLARPLSGHAFEISTFIIFVGPMTLITILYVLIAVQLRKTQQITAHRGSRNLHQSKKGQPRTTNGQRRVIKMLIAVVVAFFICWAPFHAQRLLAVYLSASPPEEQQRLVSLYLYLMYVSGVLYFVSTCVNPILYHIMSKRFRKAFKGTFRKVCCAKNSSQYLVVRKVPPPERDMQRSNSEGVPPLAREFAQNRGQSECPIRLGHAGRSSTRSTYLLSSFRGHSLKDKSSFKTNSDKNFYIMPLRLCGMFRKHDATRASFDTSNTISNSSLKDTDSSEFNRYDLVNNMLIINEKML